MIPPLILAAAEAGGWHLPGLQFRRNGDVMITLHRTGTNLMADIKYDRWRHTSARVYRGRALTAIFTGQRALADFLRSQEQTP